MVFMWLKDRLHSQLFSVPWKGGWDTFCKRVRSWCCNETCWTFAWPRISNLYNYYTSSQLLKDLYEKKTYATGTMVLNRKGFPEKIKGIVAEYNKKPWGSGIYMRDKTVVYTVWKDTKCATVGSNQHSGHADDTVLCNWKEKGERKTKKYWKTLLLPYQQ